MKKGFTLIELLAVIVILAIIALIATPIITGVISNSKIKSVENSTYGYIDAIEKKILEDEANAIEVTISDGEYKNLSIINNNITVKGHLPKNGILTIVEGEVINASICFDNYKVEYNGNNITNISKTNDCNLNYS